MDSSLFHLKLQAHGVDVKQSFQYPLPYKCS